MCQISEIHVSIKIFLMFLFHTGTFKHRIQAFHLLCAGVQPDRQA